MAGFQIFAFFLSEEKGSMYKVGPPSPHQAMCTGAVLPVHYEDCISPERYLKINFVNTHRLGYKETSQFILHRDVLAVCSEIRTQHCVDRM